MGIQNEIGHGFEYATVMAFCDYFKAQGINYDVVNNTMMSHIRDDYNKHPDYHDRFQRATQAAVPVITRLEPNLQVSTNIPITISVQPDAAGIAGDVRDVLFQRNDWTIGISCKHGNEDDKHSRLSHTNDFGESWLGIKCSDQYWADIEPVFNRIFEIRDRQPGALWRDIPNLHCDFLHPILAAFAKELTFMDAKYPGEIAEKFVKYLIGKTDYYKVIAEDTNRFTIVEGFNHGGTLNKKIDGRKPLFKIRKLELPTHFAKIEVDSEDPKYLRILCDRGWNISIRIHNGESRVTPSFKLAIIVDARPLKSLHYEIAPWM